MFSKLLNYLPVIGQLKGVYHYMRSDKQECRLAVRVSTRSTILYSACALGATLAGPLGAGIAAIACGLCAEAWLPESDDECRCHDVDGVFLNCLREGGCRYPVKRVYIPVQITRSESSGRATVRIFQNGTEVESLRAM